MLGEADDGGSGPAVTRLRARRKADPAGPAPVAAADATLAFDTYVAAQWEGLHRFAYHITGNSEEADEAVQDALVGVCSRWRRVVARGDPGVYVRRSIVNAYVSRWRRRRRTTPLADLGENLATAGDVAEGAANADLVLHLCRQLPTRQRTAIVLRFLEDYDYAEIAVICGGTEAAARSLVRHALRALRIHLNKENS